MSTIGQASKQAILVFYLTCISMSGPITVPNITKDIELCPRDFFAEHDLLLTSLTPPHSYLQTDLDAAEKYVEVLSNHTQEIKEQLRAMIIADMTHKKNKTFIESVPDTMQLIQRTANEHRQMALDAQMACKAELHSKNGDKIKQLLRHASVSWQVVTTCYELLLTLSSVLQSTNYQDVAR